MNNRRFLILAICFFTPELFGCLHHFDIKADVDANVDSSGAPKQEEPTASE